ncbi:arginase [Acidiluteibacter ferrifornacis]|nr:arginase [Acidiluteibacter ferrifornacis]
MEKIRLLEMKSEIAAGTRGSSMGIDALRIASLNKKSNYFLRYPLQKIADRNDLLWADNPTPFGIRIEGLVEVYQNVCDSVSRTLINEEFPIVLSADHGSAGGTIAGIKKAFPDKTLGVIWIDAHGDLHSPYTSPTGNMHGMPLATALGVDNEECKVNDVKEVTLQKWNELKSIGGINPKITPDNLVFFGVRDTESPEDFLMDKYGIKNFTVAETRGKGIEHAVKEALSMLTNCDILYVSFDVDSMDPDEVSYGTGTPVKDGYRPDEVKEMIKLIIQSKKVVAFEIVEINPTLDNKCNKMAETAFKILEETTRVIEENK